LAGAVGIVAFACFCTHRISTRKAEIANVGAAPTVPPNIEPVQIRGRRFAAARIEMDGFEYINCTFENCIVVFAGHMPVGMIGCTMNDCQFVFEEAAAATILFLGALYHEFGPNGRQVFEETINSIRQRAPVHGAPPEAMQQI
jgi:hypothetical protein